MGINKRGIFFSADALIALAIILIVVLIAFPIFEYSTIKTNIQQDAITVLSSLKVSEFGITNSDVTNWINLGIINDTNKTLIEQIGIFYAENPSNARVLAQNFLNSINTTENIGIWYDNQLIASKNSSAYENSGKVDVAKQTLSGIGGLLEGSATGFSARAYLTSNLSTKYIYFGGYVGEGNLSTLIKYGGIIKSAEMELVLNKNFDLYVNNNYSGSYLGSSSELQPVSYTIPIGNFTSGDNLIEFRGNNLHITGGFIKINYVSNETTYQQPTKQFFPGIKGLINVYDGIYIPGNLNSMNILLHMNSSYTAFLIIGNKTVYNGTTNGEQTIIINDTFLKGKLNYSDLSKKTVPLRLGLDNVSIIGSNTQAEVFSVTDLSGSMDDNCPDSPSIPGNDSGIANPGETPCKINDAKTANHQLIDFILNYPGNKVGLAGYETYAKKTDYYSLSNNSVSLNNVVDNIWNAGGNTCICCGILKAINCYDAKIFLDNFNGQTISSNPVGWSISESGGFIDITDNSLEGNRAVIVSRTGGSNPYLNHIFAPQEDSLSIEFLVNHTSGSGRFRLNVKDSGGSDYIILKMYTSQIRNNDAAVSSYNLNTIYKIKIDVTPSSNTYNLYVDDVLVGSNLGVFSTRSNIARVRFTTENSAITYLIDNVNVSLNSKLCNNIDINSTRSAIVMSDGLANGACGLDPVPDRDLDADITDDPQDHAIQAACDAYEKYNITVYAVAFGSGADTNTMTSMASCGHGSFYYSDVNDLVGIYNQIANNILQASYKEQTINSTGNVNTRLYENSYIEYDYTKELSDSGSILTFENKFDNNSSGSFNVPNNSKIVETKVVSYSGSKWTDKVWINGNNVYNLSKYGSDYTKLGDPYAINIPNDKVNLNGVGNIVNLTVGVAPTNFTLGSSFDKIIYTISRNFSAYSNVLPKFEGCNWTVQFEDNTNLTLKIPSGYLGSDNCLYNNTNSNYSDAAKSAVYNLFKELDFDFNGKIDYKFSQSDLDIELNNLYGIPFIQSAEVQVRVWR